MAGTIIADKWQNGDGTENFKCRAWVNFNGTGTVAIRAGGNVSSITDLGTGQYQVNFTTAMPDTNYSCSVAGIGSTDPIGGITCFGSGTKTTSTVRISTTNTSSGMTDFTNVEVAIFR